MYDQLHLPNRLVQMYRHVGLYDNLFVKIARLSQNVSDLEGIKRKVVFHLSNGRKQLEIARSKEVII